MGPKSNMAPGVSGSIGRTSASTLRKAETLEGFVQGVTRPDIILSQISQIRAWPNVHALGIGCGPFISLSLELLLHSSWYRAGPQQ